MSIGWNTGGGGAPSGPAGGDLVGTFPNPSVDGLQGEPVAGTAPSEGDVLTYSTGKWTPAAPTGGIPDAPNDGTLYARRNEAWEQPDSAQVTDATFGDVATLGTNLDARAPNVGEGSATWAANAQTVWSYTLTEGEVYGGFMTIVTRYLTGSTLSRSIADVSFVGSREVAGAAAVTQGTAQENGSGALASGTVTATAVGNTIAVRLNFPSLNGVAYFAWSHKPLIPPTS